MAETGTKAKRVLLTINQYVTASLTLEPSASKMRGPRGWQVPQTQMITGCFFSFSGISKLSKFSTVSIRYFCNKTNKQKKNQLMSFDIYS